MRPNTRKRNSKKKSEYFFDYSLLFIVLFFLGFGMVMVYSASSYDASTSALMNYDPAYYLKKQAFATLLGLAAMFVVAFIPYHFWERFATLAYIVSAVLIILVLTPLGYEANGARRWLRVGISIQPAEVAKLAMILFLASMVCRMGKSIRTARSELPAERSRP